MKKIYLLLVLGCVLILLSSVNVSAGDYDYEGTDETGDVFYISNENEFTDQHSEIDIISAKTEEQDDNIVFTLEMGSTIFDFPEYKYVFLIGSDSSISDFSVVYSNGIALLNDYFSLENSTSGGNITISVPKSDLEALSTPWLLSAYTQAYALFKDTATLEIKQTTNDNGDEGNDGNEYNGENGDKGSETEDKGTPGFELIVLLCAFAIVVIIGKKHK